MEKINAMGEVCPIPVIKAKKALKEVDMIEISVDNEIATQNLKKMAEQLNFGFSMKKLSETEYLVYMDKTGGDMVVPFEEDLEIEEKGTSYSVAVDTSIMGRGDDKLGATLMKSFFYALTEQDVLPDKVILYNGGVHLARKNSDTLEDLETLSNSGVEVYSCGACTDFYGVTSEIAVGEITNMYRIVEMMREASRIVKP